MNTQNKIYANHYQYPVNKVTIVYFFNHSKMGFSNEITVDAICNEQALDKAKDAVSGCYGSSMLKRFSFKIK
jgi:hypothetical protein